MPNQQQLSYTHCLYMECTPRHFGRCFKSMVLATERRHMSRLNPTNTIHVLIVLQNYFVAPNNTQ